MLLNFLNKLASAFFLVIAKTCVIKLDEEARLSASLVGHLLHVSLHLFNSSTVVRDRVFGVSGFSLTQESTFSSIRLHVHKLTEFRLDHLALFILFEYYSDLLNFFDDLLVDSLDTLAAPDEVRVVLDLLHGINLPFLF